MKKFITAIGIASALIATSVAAHDRDHGRYIDHRRHTNNSDLVEVIVGSIIGQVLVDGVTRRDREPYYRDQETRYEEYQYRRYEQQPTRCWEVPVRDYYGRIYYRTECNR